MAVEPRFDVIGVGANSVDYVGVLPAFPQPSGPLAKMRLRRHAITCGGQMATALVTCARLGLRAAYIGATGSDDNGRLVRQTLSQFDIDLSHLVTHDGANTFAFVLIDETTGERVIFWDRDERSYLTDAEIAEDVLLSGRLVHVDDGDERAAISAARLARTHGITVTSDIDRVRDRTFDLVDAVSVAIFAEHVPVALASRRGWQPARPAPEPDVVAAALAALPRRSGQVFCATLGARGAVAVDDHGRHYHPGFRVRVADTTGAGDVFRGAFIYARLRGWPLDEQLRFANAAAAASCTRLGAIPSVPSREEIDALLNRVPG